MIRLIGFLFFMTLISCSSKRTDKTKINQVETVNSNGISVIDSEFPLRIGTIDFNDSTKIIQLNDKINSKLEQTINDYYFNACSGDSAETYFSIKDIYINTIRLRDSIFTVFVVLLKHMPDGLINSKILFYNNDCKQFIDKVIDFNIHALYYFKDGKLIPTNLKEQFKITTPEIELINDKQQGMNNFKFTRLYHNGTANAIETVILQVTDNKVDSLDFKQKWIQ